jgi:hypothetical protein
MRDTPLMQEARQLIAFYDEHGCDWTSALSFILCRDLFGSGFTCHPKEGWRYSRVNPNTNRLMKSPPLAAPERK